MLGSKISNLLLAEKNVIDFVDKNLGQERDRLKQNELEMDFMCNHLTGGILDYPKMISHDFCDVTTAWDIYIDAFTKETTAKIPKRFGFGVFTKPQSKNDRLIKMPFRGDELTVKQFVNAVIGCGPKIRTHIVDCTEECVQSGRLENLYVIISNVVIIRNYLWVFQEIFDSESKSKLKGEYKLFCELVEVISEQMLQCQSNLLCTYILHDEYSQNWSSVHSYYEGERASPTIQMWSYFLKSMQRDMWKIMPPLLSQRILSIILNDSLGILTSRYSKIQPTEATNSQFSCDIINILATVEEFLFFISVDLISVFGQSEPSASKTLFSIHTKCHCLAASLVIVGCPIEVLYKTFRRGMSSCSLLEFRKKDKLRLTEPPWMSMLSLLCPNFYPIGLSYSDWELLCYVKLLTAQPSFNWSLVYKVVTMNDCKIAAFILSLFPTVVAPSSDFLLEGKAFKRCGNAACMDPDCHSLPKSISNHLAAASTLYIIAHAMPRDFMVKVYRPILPRIKDWSVMDKTQIWNSKSRPVWFQSLMDILLPILKTCVQSLCVSLAESSFMTNSKPSNDLGKSDSSSSSRVANNKSTGKTTESNEEEEEQSSTKWVIELLNTLTEILSIIPRGFFMVCEDMDDLIPPEYIPVRNNVPVHFLVTALYMLLNSGAGVVTSILGNEIIVPTNGTGQEGVNSSEKPISPATILEPLLLATAERLCHLDDFVFDQAIHRLVTQIESMMKQTQVQTALRENSVKIPSDFSIELDISILKADFLLEEVEGQLALRIVYWFLVTHGDMLESLIVGKLNSDSSSDNPMKNSKSRSKSHDSNSTPSPLDPKPSSSTSATTTKHSTPLSLYQVAKMKMHVLKIAPRIRTYIKTPSIMHDFHFVNKYRTFDEIIWKYETMDWVQTVRQCRMGLQKPIIYKLLERRWEFQQNFSDDNNSSGGAAGNRDPSHDKLYHLSKMVDEIKALITA